MADTIETVRATGDRQPIMTTDQARDLEKRQGYDSHYYAVFLKNDATDEFVRVRTPVWHLDAERRPVEVDGKRRVRNPHDVALDVWAAYGADDHTLQMVMRGGFVVSTPASIASSLAMRDVQTDQARAA